MNPTSQLDTDILKSVSRSFYLSLRVLPRSVRSLMALGYLLCRAADTIADTTSNPIAERTGLLKSFRQLFSSFPIPEEQLKDLVRDLSYANLAPKTGEGKLLESFSDCAAWFNSFSKTDQALLQQVVLAVIEGMEMDLRTFGDSAETLRALSTEKDLENYINWIGGQPGYFWTNACLSHIPELKISNRDQWIQDGIIFGTGLQMVNILRDLPADLKRGRCYLPLELLSAHGLSPQDLLTAKKEDQFRTLYIDLIDQTVFRLERGYSYVRELPVTAFGLRMAVGLPMRIGLKTLEKLRETPSVLTAKEPVKVKRWEVYWLLVKSI